jgi:hypothetical protein
VRSPFDDAIAAQQDEAVVEEQDPVRAAERRPPGGKPLLRLMALLQRDGFAEPAATAVALAVPDDARAAFEEHLARLGAAPDAQAKAPARARGRGRAAAKKDGAWSTEEIAEAYRETGERLGPPTPTGPQWRSLGPWTIPNGQTYGASRVNVSGRVAAIAVHPASPARVLCGAANGGVWESFDRGASWTPRTDYQATLTVGAIAYDARNPSVVYCGTGEGNWWAFLGAGVLRSTDGGSSWATLVTAPFVGQGFYDLKVDAGNSNRLVAGTTGGLYVSTNAGAGWTQRRSSTTWSVSMARTGTTKTLEILAACSDGVFRSTNGGTSWSSVALPGSPGAFDRLAVAIAPSNPKVAYAWGASGATAFLWRRNTAGTWTSVPVPPGVSTGQAWYDWYLAVSPDRANQIYLGAIESYRGELSGSTWTWLNLSNKGSTGDSIHPDQHAIAFEPGQPDTIYIGCDGGLFRSPDRGVTFASANNGLMISEFEFLAQHPGSTRYIVGGTQDNGTERYLGSTTWEHAADGDGGDCAVNRTNPDTVFHTYYGMSPERSTTAGAFGSWTYVPPPVPAGEGSLFYPPYEASAAGGDTVAMGGDALYVSRNNAAAWTRLAYPGGGRASALAIPEPNTVLVGLVDGQVLRTTWTGSAWTAIAALGTPNPGVTVSDLQVDPNTSSRLWATCSAFGGARVFRSDDGGAHWTDCTGTGLPALPLNAVALDPGNANRLWVAADLGVYQSTNAGATWTDFSSSLPNAFVGDLIFHQHARVLRAGTRNRGVWEIPVDGWMTQPQCGVQWTGSLVANQTQKWFTFNWPAAWHVVWTVMPTSPRAGAPQVSWVTQVERASAEYATYWISVTNMTADPVTFEGRYCILSRY